jgi:MYST family zinc finger domain
MSASTAGAGPAATTVSNIREVVLGDMWIAPWYPSFYPEELVGTNLDRLYVCPHCFKYTKELVPYRGHLDLCEFKDLHEALGGLVYEKGSLSVVEVDGEDFKVIE